MLFKNRKLFVLHFALILAFSGSRPRASRTYMRRIAQHEQAVLTMEAK